MFAPDGGGQKRRRVDSALIGCEPARSCFLPAGEWADLITAFSRLVAAFCSRLCHYGCSVLPPLCLAELGL
ncbi:unnamed protein product [Protopolystoma xenopodis]|uniref:Uncharacterized protein n=1 Tax=Protopolystoma xenopodis TaxID=117903 RepID=A0A448WYZ6_9PLAT|nr:unnamed protein product [Protopolystoma xenopodis]